MRKLLPFALAFALAQPACAQFLVAPGSATPGDCAIFSDRFHVISSPCDPTLTYTLSTATLDGAGIGFNINSEFGGTWRSAVRQELIRTDDTVGGNYFTSSILSDDDGLSSGGESSNTGGLFVEAKRTDYLTSTEEGQVVGIYTNTFAGRVGTDSAAAILGGAYKTIPVAGLAGTSGDLLAYEFRSTIHDETGIIGADQLGQISIVAGWWNNDTAFDYTWETKFLGLYVESADTNTYGSFAGYLSNDQIDVNSTGWEWYFVGQTSRDNAPSFGIAGSANANYNEGTIFSYGGGLADDRVVLQSDNAGAGGGPNLTIYRNSSTPAALDSLGAVRFDGEDSAGNTQIYANIGVLLNDPLSTAEDAAFTFQTVVAGTLAQRVGIAAGLVVGVAAVSDPGAGNVNISGEVQVNGTKVLGARDTGFTPIAGAANENCGALDIATITATDANLRAVLACLKASQVALVTHGLIGP